MKSPDDVTSRAQFFAQVSAPIMSLNDVAHATSLSRSTIYRMVNKGTFPQPIALSTKRCGFYVHEVNEWLISRPRLTANANEFGTKEIVWP